ncbi:hypothetical protein E2C01_024229 [Portunus trituberculatus]|uniref:Uncharacterized protein n=1 Tax=Portunus trituberculatus TaxID=210409 RepID=A0A5B7EC86_PORTR|nr:hypothetical protein [Portunus trituberculatus]
MPAPRILPPDICLSCNTTLMKHYGHNTHSTLTRPKHQYHHRNTCNTRTNIVTQTLTKQRILIATLLQAQADQYKLFTEHNTENHSSNTTATHTAATQHSTAQHNT